MCGMVGVRDAFYSKTKRFCSVSCSRSYSSNSKKASILARLQVCHAYSLIKQISMCFIWIAPFKRVHSHDFLCSVLSQRGNHQQKKQRSYRNSLSWQNWQLMHSINRISRAQLNQNQVSLPWWKALTAYLLVFVLFFFLLFLVKETFVHIVCVCVSFLAAIPVEGFDWGRYICSNNLIGAPVSCFKHVRVVY